MSGSGVGLWLVSAPLEGTRIEDDGESAPVGFSDDMVVTRMEDDGELTPVDFADDLVVGTVEEMIADRVLELVRPTRRRGIRRHVSYIPLSSG